MKGEFKVLVHIRNKTAWKEGGTYPTTPMVKNESKRAFLSLVFHR